MALYAGVMSGTSLDGIDIAFAEIDAVDSSPLNPRFAVRPSGSYYEPFPKGLRRELARVRANRPVRIETISRIRAELAERYADAVLAGARRHGIELKSTASIGMHGQTVWHNPPSAEKGPAHTLQLGSPAIVAERTGVAVVSDFRAADIAAGGEGAPLIPFADYILLSSPTQTRAVLNLGGIANVTYLPAGGALADTRAFDTGPGNMVIDAAVWALTGGKAAFDDAGRLAARGTPAEAVVRDLLNHPYFQKPPPKSTGAELFGAGYARAFLDRCSALPPEDTIATATALTARSIAQSLQRFLPGLPDRLILGGGGAHNATLMRLLGELLPGVAVCRHDEFGIDGDSKEALAFALLAAAHVHRIPASIPAATGASGARILGSYTPAPSRSS